MSAETDALRVGVYIDIENITRNGGRGIRFDVLRAFACRSGGTPIRLNAYLAYDEARAERDRDYRLGAEDYQDALREDGFKVLRKRVQWFSDDEGKPVSKANVDLDMAVDMLLQSERLDRVLLATGDGDFAQVVRALQNRGCRVDVVAFQSVSHLLRQEADYFIPGYLIPGLQSTMIIPAENKRWGELGSRVRGVCHHFNEDKGFGFVRFLKHIQGDLFDTDSRSSQSPYETAFVHVSALPNDLNSKDLPSRDIILEFTLAPPRSTQTATSKAAIDVRMVHRY